MILTGIVIWNDFMLPLIFLGTSRSTTLPVVIYSFVGENLSEWNLIFAVVIIAMIPALLAFLFAQRRFIQGFAGGLKG
jgi:raffinose/stachyose/melibiose transport system permease protein